jgi:hypothetical protein
VITGAAGRRRWSPEAKARIVAESLAPAGVISEVAPWHDLRPQQLFAWRHQARQGRLALPAAELSFVPVVSATDAPPAEVGFVGLSTGRRCPPKRSGAAFPVARTRCISLIAADRLTAKRRAPARIELPARPRVRCAAAGPWRSEPA